MQIVIDIPKEYYKVITEIPNHQCTADMLIIKYGKPLPESHGDLIDRNKLIKQYGLENATKYGNKNAEQQRYSYSTMMMYEIADMIDDAETVIPTTKEKSCKDCGHGFDSEDCYNCDKNIQNTCEPKQTATKKEKLSCDTCKHKDKKYKEFPCIDCLEKDRYEGDSE